MTLISYSDTSTILNLCIFCSYSISMFKTHLLFFGLTLPFFVQHDMLYDNNFHITIAFIHLIIYIMLIYFFFHNAAFLSVCF